MISLKSNRKSNIDLLRVFATCGVIILHYNNPTIGGALQYVENSSFNYLILYFFESLNICAVNVFILISGYFMCTNQKRTLFKPVQLLIQVIFFSTIIYLVRVIMGLESFDVVRLLSKMIPSNYYVILYSVLYLISPYINITLNMLTRKKLNEMLILFMIIFSIYPTFVDFIQELSGKEWVGLSSISAYGSQWGYSIINFILLYILGAYLRIKGEYRGKTKKLCLVFLVNIFVLVGWSLVNEVTGFFTERSAWEYCNPLVILESILIFRIFENIKVRYNIVINVLAEASFTVFLVHTVFLRYLQIENHINKNIGFMLIHLIASVVVIYGIGVIIDKIYKGIMDFIFKFLKDKIPFYKIDVSLKEN